MNKYIKTMLAFLCLACASAYAQKITHEFCNTSLSEALIAIDRSARRYNINFIYDELEDFVVTADIRNRSVPDAVRDVCGFYPIRITFSNDSIISVECMQKENTKLTGRLVDEHGRPVEFANVALLSANDSTFVTGGVTNADGMFVIPCAESRIIARFTFVGYKTVYRNTSVGNIGTVHIRPETTMISGVTVKGTRPVYKMVRGGMDISVQNTVLSNAGTANDVLSMLPRVQGSDGNFTVFAKGTPEIYINNRKVQGKNELQQLKSQDIKSVEVITSPGARYNAEVNAIIKIKTIRPQGDGFSISAFSQTSRNNKWQTYDDLGIKYRRHGLEVFVNADFNNGNHSEDNTIGEELNHNGNIISIEQYCPNTFWYSLTNGKTGISYDFDSDNSIGMSYEISQSIYQRGWAQGWQTIQRNDIEEGTVSYSTDVSMDDGPAHNINMYYTGKIGKLGIDFNGSYIWNKDGRHDINEESSKELDDKTVSTDNSNKRHMTAGKLILTYPVWKGTISVGSEMTHTSTHGIYKNTNSDIKASDDKIRESNTAGFAEYEIHAGNWHVGGGLRFEHVTSDYESFGQWQAEPSRKYNDFFPNMSIAWQKDKAGIELSYNKRTSRPSYYQLNNFIQYDNRYSYEGGNPLLRPSKRQDISLSAMYSWLNASIGYEHNKDKSLSFGSLYNGQDIALWQNRNFSKFEVFTASVVASPAYGFYKPTAELGYWQQKFSKGVSGVDRSLSKPEFSITLRNWFIISKTCNAMLYMRYATSHDYGFTREARQFTANARIQKSFLNDAISVVVYANDIFKTTRSKWAAYYPNITMRKDAYTYTQAVGISLSYKLNATRSKYKGTGAGNEEKSRL